MRLRLAALLLLATSVVGVLGTPAAGEIEVHNDPRGDVQRVDQRGQVRTSADVLQVRGRHEGSSVTVTLDVVDLTSKPIFIALQMRSPTGADYTIELERRRDRSKDTFMAKSTRRAATVIVCRELTGRFFDVQDRVVVTVPRTCLNRPRWVRFGALAAASSRGYERIYADDARRVGGRFEDDRPVLGSRRLHHD